MNTDVEARAISGVVSFALLQDLAGKVGLDLPDTDVLSFKDLRSLSPRSLMLILSLHSSEDATPNLPAMNGQAGMNGHADTNGTAHLNGKEPLLL